MIDVTRLNGKNFVLNAELIEVMEETPDTVITLTTGHKYVVKESLDDKNFGRGNYGFSYTIGNYYWFCHGCYRYYNKYNQSYTERNYGYFR